jgi:hypothetical protein
MQDTRGTWQPDEVIEPIIEEIKADDSLWELALDREFESKEIQELARCLASASTSSPRLFPSLMGAR